ncbi:8-oxoguanine DNA glycosylase OGG fold protein [Aquimarina intermedia]|uniref:Uncharacterized protein n=1 Tax=Aquimarina intermedia TaxID=350814 RepID=A0A5S5BV21_9FLAO|nr:hypothetical protein [Aquimarina intermedia]TYP71021.1 hypothetical protein BD809_11080 [Aquimarina intermedia]
MNIENYKELILSLPIRQQCFTTNRNTWKKAENEVRWLKLLNDKLFEDNQTLTISRQDIFETKETRAVIIKTIYWGYARGMRGNHFVNILSDIEFIESAFLKLKQTEQIKTCDFKELTKTLTNVSGIGLSTYSKLLYFFNLKINNIPCLILDRRLIDVFKSQMYVNFQFLRSMNYHNAEKKYLDFLQVMNQNARKIETEGENIEQFLFLFGNNLRTTDTIA